MNASRFEARETFKFREDGVWERRWRERLFWSCDGLRSEGVVVTVLGGPKYGWEEEEAEKEEKEEEVMVAASAVLKVLVAMVAVVVVVGGFETCTMTGSGMLSFEDFAGDTLEVEPGGTLLVGLLTLTLSFPESLKCGRPRPPPLPPCFLSSGSSSVFEGEVDFLLIISSFFSKTGSCLRGCAPLLFSMDCWFTQML